MLDGKYGSTFLYSGSIYQAEKLKAYSTEEIHVRMLPDFGSDRTNIAAWSYAGRSQSYCPLNRLLSGRIYRQEVFQSYRIVR